jgi:hypothetical protein
MHSSHLWQRRSELAPSIERSTLIRHGSSWRVVRLEGQNKNLHQISIWTWDSTRWSVQVHDLNVCVEGLWVSETNNVLTILWKTYQAIGHVTLDATTLQPIGDVATAPREDHRKSKPHWAGHGVTYPPVRCPS